MLFRSDRKSTRLNSSHTIISYAVFCLKKKKKENSNAVRSDPPPTFHVVPASSHTTVGIAKLPIMYAPLIPITYRKIYHTVKPGESLSSIARRYGVAMVDMKRWNPQGAMVGQRVTMEVRSSAKPKGKQRAQPKGKPKKNVG